MLYLFFGIVISIGVVILFSSGLFDEDEKKSTEDDPNRQIRKINRITVIVGFSCLALLQIIYLLKDLLHN